MMDTDLGAAQFPYWFDFVRLSPAEYRDQSGMAAVAGPGEPRFDHDEAGVPLGLMVSAGIALGAGDRVSLKSAVLADAIGEEVTVLHAIQFDGELVRRAWFGTNARLLVNGLLATVAHHVSIGVVPGYLPNKGGLVRARGHSWYLANAIAVDSATVLTDGSRTLIDQ